MDVITYFAAEIWQSYGTIILMGLGIACFAGAAIGIFFATSPLRNRYIFFGIPFAFIVPHRLFLLYASFFTEYLGLPQPMCIVDPYVAAFVLPIAFWFEPRRNTYNYQHLGILYVLSSLIIDGFILWALWRITRPKPRQG